MGIDQRDRLATAIIVAILAGTAVASMAAQDTVPPVLPTVVPLIAAAFFSSRVTALVALVAIAEVSLLSRYSEGYTGWALGSRVGMTVLSAVLAVVLAEMRIRHEAEISQARRDLRVAGLLQAVVDSANDPIYAKDPEGRYLAANNAAAATLGVDHGADLIGHRDRDFVGPERADRIEADDRETLAAGGRLEFEEEVDRPDHRILLTHKTVIHDDAGELIGLSGIAKDVTVKRQAQHELERSERRFRSLVEASAAIVWRTSPAGEFVEPQGRWQEYTGQTWEQHRGLEWLAAIHPDDREQVGEEWHRALASGSFHESVGRLWHASDALFRHVVIRAAPVVGTDGAITEWLCACEDLHDQFLAEQRLRHIADARDLVAEVASRVAVAIGRREVAQGALTVLQERLPAHIGSVTLLDPDDPSETTIFAVQGADGWDDFGSLSKDLDLPPRHVAATRRSVEFPDVESLVAAHADAGALVDALGVRGATFAIPLDTGARVMGALSVTFKAEVPDEVLELTRLACAELDSVLAHSLLQAEFHEREAEIASSFQQSMLELAIQADPRLALSFHYQAGAEQMEAGGDWYDVVPLADGRIALMVGDVVGRSLTAATVMGRLRGACRGLLLATGDAATVLSFLDTVADTIEGARFSTCCCVVIDPVAQTATYSSAGHPPALVLPFEADPVFLWDAQGPPLTVPIASRPSATVAFPTGSRLFLYTDGLVERRNEMIDKGLDRLVAAAVAGRHASVDEECDRIATALFDDFSQNDDVAIVCAETVSDSVDEFTRHLRPDTAVLHRVRRDLLVWLAGHKTAHARAQEIVLAVGEALANSVEHAHPSADGIAMRVTKIDRRRVEAVVTDDGHWRETPADPTRGRGLSIISALADELDVDRADHGTTVQMCFTV